MRVSPLALTCRVFSGEEVEDDDEDGGERGAAERDQYEQRDELRAARHRHRLQEEEGEEEEEEEEEEQQQQQQQELQWQQPQPGRDTADILVHVHGDRGTDSTVWTDKAAQGKLWIFVPMFRSQKKRVTRSFQHMKVHVREQLTF